MRKNYFRDKNVGPIRATQFAYDIIRNEYYTGPGCGLKKQLMKVDKHPEKYPYTNISVDEMVKKAKERIENKNNYGKRK